MKLRRILALPVATFLAMTGGCGSSSTTSAGGTSNAPAGEASKTPEQIVADVRAALGRVHSFRLQGTQTSPSGKSQISAAIGLPGKFQATLTRGGQIVQLVYIDGKGYFTAGRGYWAARSSNPVVLRLADRWIETTTALTPQLAQFSALTDPSTIGQCVVGANHGTLSKAGTASVNGRPAVIIADKGDAPGSAPGMLYVASTGPALPLRTVQSGPRKPGGTLDPACHKSSNSTTLTSEELLTDYDQPVVIAAPAHPVSLAQLAAQAK
jgi:hypothetical protein